MLAVDPARRGQPPAIDREELLRTYVGAGEPVERLAVLVLGDEAADVPPGTARGATAITDAQRFRIIVPRTLPEPLVRMAERLQAVLIRSGGVATLEHTEPRAAGSIGTIAILSMSPRSSDPCLRFWDLVRALEWMNPAAAPILRDMITEVAARPDPVRLLALAEEVGAAFGLVPIARVPLEWWLRDEVVVDPEAWHWPHLWVEPAGQESS
jgi:hypothetical protein